MKITQVELLNQFTPAMCYRMICWLPSEHNWKRGMKVQLKDQSETVWTVHEVYSTQEHFELNRKWEVGGL